MSKSALSLGFGGAVALAVTLVSPAARADTPRYRYVDLSQLTLPVPYAVFAPSAVIDGQVFGTVFDSAFSVEAVAEYHNGQVTIGPAGSASVANLLGAIGGADPNGEAALFKGTTTTLIPRLPNEAFANVVGLSVDGLALVSSTDTSFVSTFAYFLGGKETVIDFGLPDPVFGGFMNDLGQVAVTKQESPVDPFLHGYLYHPLSKKSTLLPPYAGDPRDVLVLVQGINARGEVLGYSFTQVNVLPYHERVGFWDQAAVFHPYFEETIVTNLLVANDFDQIVISNSSDSNSYLVPTPGTRLNLASLVANVPAGLQLGTVVGIDDAQNITGFATDANFNSYPFLLVPMGAGDGYPGDVHVGGFPIPWAIAHDASHPHK